jgi:hypothetical protein
LPVARLPNIARNYAFLLLVAVSASSAIKLKILGIPWGVIAPFPSNSDWGRAYE